MNQKIKFQGKIIGVQPRIRLLRSFDETSHSYLGFSISLNGKIGDERRNFLIGIGKGAQAKHLFKCGDSLSGECLTVENTSLETVEFYKVSKLKIMEKEYKKDTTTPPWIDTAPELQVYRERGHRRLSGKTYSSKCVSCIWGCNMAVEITIDHWNPGKKKYRNETFCYGPKSCSFYVAGPNRQVPGRKGMKYIEENLIDEQATSHRGPHE